MPDPKKKKKRDIHPWIQKLDQWDKQFKNTEAYKNVKKGLKTIQKNTQRKFIEYKKRKAEEKKNRYKKVYKYGGYYKKNN